MRSLNLYNSFTFLLACGALAWHTTRLYSGSESLSIVLIALLAWTLEYKAVRRKPVDFSGGFVFYLATAFLGDGIAALLILMAGAGVRSARGARNMADLITAGGVVMICTAIQSFGKWPQDQSLKLGLGVLVLGLWAGVFQSYNKKLFYQQKSSGQKLLLREDYEVGTIRLYLCLYALAGAALQIHSGWLLALAAPLFLVASKAAGNAGFRVHAKQATEEKAQARETHRELSKTKKELKAQERVKSVLESVTEIFSKPMSPEEVFQELHRVCSEVAAYRSLILFVKDAERLEPVIHHSPERGLELSNNFTLSREPILEQAWNKDKPKKGSASNQPEARLLPTEGHILAVPVKPLGILYFGREENEPFSKGEAGRLCFVIQKASPALLRADYDVRTRHELKDQKRKSRKLQVKVALSAQLVEAAEAMLVSVSRDSIYETLQKHLEEAVHHQYGCIISFEQRSTVRSWGGFQGEEAMLIELMDYILPQNKILYLPDLPNSRFAKISGSLNNLLVCPLSTEHSQFGILVVGCRAGTGLTSEQRDFVHTCACLAASGLLSQTLLDQVKEAHEQVVQASKLSAIGQLAAGVAHELNSPLAAIGLALEAAQLRPEKSARKLERASDALDRARDIVKNLLEHSRKSGPIRKLITPASVIKGALGLIKPQLTKRKIEVKVQCADIEDLVLANSVDLQQVLINLLLNAADASEDDAEVILFARQDEATILIGVQDNGSGIPSDVRGRVFDPFFTTKPVGQGTGLGLSVCKQLVERHYGNITFETEQGKGTRFSISFPARKAEGNG